MANPSVIRRAAGTRVAIVEEAKEFAAGIAGEWLINLIPADWVLEAADKLPDQLLTDGDSRKRWSAAIGLVVSGLGGLESSHRNALQNFLEQTAEEIGKRRDKLDGKGGEADRKVIREAMKASESKLHSLRKKEEQGEKVQKRALPDYFSAKAAIKDETCKKTLSEIEQAMKTADKDAYERFMRSGAYRIHTTPEELIDIAKASKEPDHTYGVERLKSLMSGQRGEGGVGGKLKVFTEDLVEDVFSGGGLDQAAATFDAKVAASRKLVQDATAKRRRFQ